MNLGEMFERMIEGHEERVFLNVNLTSRDKVSIDLLEALPGMLGKEDITIGEAMDLLQDAMWWVITLGSLEDKDGEEE